MIILFLLDILIYSVTSINIPLIIFLLPFEKNIFNIILISIVLILIDIHYWMLIVIILILFMLNYVLKRQFRLTIYTYFILLIFDFMFYYLFTGLIKA